MTATSEKNPLKAVTRVAFGALICALMAPGVYGLLGVAFGVVNARMPIGAIFGPAWLMASGLTLVAILFVGIPAFLFLRSRDAATLLASSIVGVVVGVLIFVLLGATIFGQFDLRTGTSLGLTGALIGGAFRLLAGSMQRE